MTQQGHLTTEQLSAFLDKQLTPQEQAFFDAHLHTCDRCQHALTELRRTVALLHAMPQPVLPRSFTLPTTIAPIQIQTVRPQAQPAQQRRPLRYPLRRTMRAVSTIAAVIGLIFVLSGLLPNFQLGGGAANTASAPSGGVFTTSSGETTVPQAHPNTPNVKSTRTANSNQGETPASSPTSARPTPATTPTHEAKAGVPNPSSKTPTLPPVLDLSQPAGRLSLGALLLILSIIGIVITRRRRNAVY